MALDLTRFEPPNYDLPHVVARGVVTRAPASTSDSLQVALINMTAAYTYTVGAMHWQSRGATLPTLGTQGVVVFDDNHDAWLAVWEGHDQTAAGTLVAAKMTRSGAALQLAAGWNKIPLDTATYDVGAGTGYGFNATQTRYNVGVGGFYALVGSVGIGGLAAGTMVIASIYVNGVERSRTDRHYTATGSTNDPADFQVADQLRLNAGDYVELYAYTTMVGGVEQNVPTVWLALSLINGGAVGPPGSPGAAVQAFAVNATVTIPSIAAGQFAQIPIPAGIVAYDTQNGWGVHSFVWTCQIAGYYYVTYGFQGTIALAANQNCDIAITYNGATATQVQGISRWTSPIPGTTGPMQNGSGLFYCPIGTQIGLAGGTVNSGGVPGTIVLEIASFGGAGPQGAVGPAGPVGAGAYTTTSPDAFFLAA